MRDGAKLYFFTTEGVYETPAFEVEDDVKYWKHKASQYERLDNIKSIEELPNKTLIAHNGTKYNLIDEANKLNLNCWNYFKNASDKIISVRLMKEAGSRKRITVELMPGEILATIGVYFEGTHLAIG